MNALEIEELKEYLFNDYINELKRKKDNTCIICNTERNDKCEADIYDKYDRLDSDKYDYDCFCDECEKETNRCVTCHQRICNQCLNDNTLKTCRNFNNNNKCEGCDIEGYCSECNTCNSVYCNNCSNILEIECRECIEYKN